MYSIYDIVLVAHTKMDALHLLRRLDFPDCVRAALDKLVTCLNSSDTSIPGLAPPIDDIIDQIVAEFIFCQTSNKQKQPSRVGSLL